MIIDLILDRKDGKEFNPKDFYFSCMGYRDLCPGDADRITAAMDGGTEKDVRRALCSYIDNQGYAPEIKNYINGVKWLAYEDDPVTYFLRVYG